MEYKVGKYTGVQLAKMDTSAAAAAIGSHVRSLVAKAGRAVLRADFGTEDEYRDALVRKESAAAGLWDYLDDQRALFRAKRLDPDRAYREAIFPTGETLPNGTAMFRIVPRGFSLEPEETDPDTDRIRVRLDEHPAMSVAKDEARGTYRDGGMLIEQSTCSVDMSERM